MDLGPVLEQVGYAKKAPKDVVGTMLKHVQGLIWGGIEAIAHMVVRMESATGLILVPQVLIQDQVGQVRNVIMEKQDVLVNMLNTVAVEFSNEETIVVMVAKMALVFKEQNVRMGKGDVLLAVILKLVHQGVGKMKPIVPMDIVVGPV